MIQGGDPLGSGTADGLKFADEFNPSAQHSRLCRAMGAEHHGSQFYHLAATPWSTQHSSSASLDGRMLWRDRKTTTSKPGDRPVKPISIQSVKIERT